MMSRWRLILIAGLMLLPVVLLVGIGLWKAVQSGHWLWLSWLLPVSWGAAWLVLRSSRQKELPLPEIGSRVHWTPQDQSAAVIITSEQGRVGEASAAQLIDPEFYQQVTIDLATKLARHYHPKSTDPVGSLSIVELLAIAHLVSEDLEDWFQTYVPGSHLITVSQWRMLGNVPGWWNVLANVGSIASVVLDPTKLPRYVAMRGTGDPLVNLVKSNLLEAFCRFYIQRIGYYLVELNSGRLRGGSSRYRQTVEKINPSTSSSRSAEAVAPTETKASSVTVTIAIVGQVKSGKSSLANCLLGDQQAAVDVLPLTRDVTRYELTGSAVTDRATDRLILLDTPGYSDSGATAAQKQATLEAVRHADLVLLVLAATSPAKQADSEMLADMSQWFQEHRQLKPPPVIGVISKVDALSPLMEWLPPYHWEEPSRPKEHSIRNAVDYATEVLGTRLSSAVPVVTDREHGRIYGIEEWLLPTIALHLDDARAVSLVRSLHHEYDQQRTWQVVSQFIRAGQQIHDAVRASDQPNTPAQ
jgi:predicted GTPase